MTHLRTTAVAIAAMAVLATAAPLSTPASAAAPRGESGCTTGSLPSVVQGNPGIKGNDGGVFLWHDGSGYSLRALHGSSSRIVIQGTLQASAGFSSFRFVRLEKGDYVRLSKDRKTVVFRFVNRGYLDGFDFTANCSTVVRAHVGVAGRVAPTGLIKLGAKRAHPTSNPFVIKRDKPVRLAG